MSKFLRSGFGLTLIASVLTTAVQAEEMSSDEIYRRLQIQQQNSAYALPSQGGATRGLSLNYGTRTSPADAAVEAPETSGVVLYQDSGSTQAYQDTGTYTGAAAPEQYPESLLPYSTTAIPTETVPSPVPVSIDSYQAVEQDARIDLRVYFEWNSAALKPEAVGQLSQLCAALQQVVGQNVFKIIGHTDKSGSDDYNLYLSEARAREVKRHLVEECAISRDSLLAIGEGERQSNPNAPQRDPSERRVEVQLVS